MVQKLLKFIGWTELVIISIFGIVVAVSVPDAFIAILAIVMFTMLTGSEDNYLSNNLSGLLSAFLFLIFLFAKHGFFNIKIFVKFLLILFDISFDLEYTFFN